jgi:putative PIN family toxin of toxin-antitoxin system
VSLAPTRIVLDTNVLVSGLLSELGAPGQILDLLLAGDLLLLHDPRILAEYREVVARPELGIAAGQAAEILAFLEQNGESISALPWPHALPDPDDEPFLAVARAGHATGLVTGNLRHFPAALRGGVRVWSPRELIAWLRRLAATEQDR